MRTALLLLFGLFLAFHTSDVNAFDNVPSAEDIKSSITTEVSQEEKIDVEDSTTPVQEDLTEEQVIAGLKAILKLGLEDAAAKLGKRGSFSENEELRLYLPSSLNRVKKALGNLGITKDIDALELRMNRAAEDAVSPVAGYFMMGINQLKFKDVQKVLDGEEITATTYMDRRMYQGLAKVVRPIVKKKMSRTGTYRAFEDVMDQYRRIPYAPRAGADLEGYIVQNVMDAIFMNMAIKENAIRKNPEERTREEVKILFEQSSQ